MKDHLVLGNIIMRANQEEKTLTIACRDRENSIDSITDRYVVTTLKNEEIPSLIEYLQETIKFEEMKHEK